MTEMRVRDIAELADLIQKSARRLRFYAGISEGREVFIAFERRILERHVAELREILELGDDWRFQAVVAEA